MKKILLFVLIAPLLIGAACTTKNTNTKNTDDNNSEFVNENINTDSDTVSQDDTKDDAIVETKINYEDYENKAIGYKVLIPEKWYWQHFMKNELTKAGVNEAIDDYLILDKLALIGFGSEYLGRIVIEKSSFDLENLKKDLDTYTSKEVNINGQAATRLELNNNDSNTKTIQYLFNKNNMTFRLIYQMVDSDSQNEAIFEKVVNSFSFVE